MSGQKMMELLTEVLDGHRWEELPALLHPDFSCRYVHTDETFDRAAWVLVNAQYPGFQHFVLEECVADGNRAAGRAHVTGISQGRLQHFEVASFIAVRDGLIADMTEVWTDVDEVAPTAPGRHSGMPATASNRPGAT